MSSSGGRTRTPSGPRSFGAVNSRARRCPRRRQIVWGGCNGRQQRSDGGVSDPGGLPRRGHAGGSSDGGRRGAQGGSAVLPLPRGAPRGGAGGGEGYPPLGGGG